MNRKGLVILTICICLILCSAGCVTATKNLIKPKPTPTETLIPVHPANITPIPTPYRTPGILYSENWDEYMFRTNGHWLREWVEYKRENVEGQKDIDLRATVYRALFLPNYWYWSVSWGQYLPQVPAEGMKYLVVFAHIRMEGTSQDDDPRIWGPGQDHFVIQIKNETFGIDTNHEIGYRIKELENYSDMMNVSKIYDYGYMRYYDNNGQEKAMDLGYIRMGVSNAWDGFLLFEVPKTATLDDIIILERIDGLGNVWWYLKPKPLS